MLRSPQPTMLPPQACTAMRNSGEAAGHAARLEMQLIGLSILVALVAGFLLGVQLPADGTSCRKKPVLH